MFKSCIALVVGLALTVTSGAQVEGKRFSLEDLLGVARERSPAILAAEQRVEALHGERTSAATPASPDVEFSRGTGQTLDGSANRQEHGWAVSQTIEWPGRWHARIKAADGMLEAGRAGSLATKADVLASVQEQYFGILFSQKEAALLEDQAAAAESLLTLAEKRVQVGEARELDRIKARVEALRTERKLESARSEVRVRKAVLDQFLLGALGEQYELLGGFTLPAAVPARDTVLTRLLSASPALREARARAEASEWTLKAERQGRFPDLTAAYLDTNELDRKARTVSLALRIPLWGFNSGPIRTAKAEREAALLEEARLKAEVASRGEEAYQGFALAFTQAKSYETDLLPSAEKSLKIATFSYAQGELSLLDLLDARRTYLDSVEEYNDVLFQFESARAQLERLIGGSLVD